MPTGRPLVLGLRGRGARDREHGRRLRRHRPDAGDVRPRPARRASARTTGVEVIGATWPRRSAIWSPPSASSSRSRGCRRRKTARHGNLARRRRRGARLRGGVPRRGPRPHAADPGRHRGRHGGRGPGCAAGRDDPDAAAGRAVQRRRRCRGRPGRGLELTPAPGSASTTAAIAGAFTVLVGAVSFSGSCVTFAKLQELMTTRPVVFPGGPVVFGGVDRVAVGLAVGVVVDARDGDVNARPAGAARPGGARGRRAVRAAGRRRGRTDRHLAAQRLHRPDRRGQRLRARQHAAARRGHPGRRVRHDPDPDDGLGDGPVDGEHPVRRLPGRVDRGVDRGQRPAGPLRGRRGRRDPARRTPARWSSCPATAWRSPRRSTRSTSWSTCCRRRVCRSSTASTRSPAGCPGT